MFSSQERAAAWDRRCPRRSPRKNPVSSSRHAIKRDATQRPKRWSATGAQVFALPCDIRRRDQTRRLSEGVTKRWGAVQILINNAGIAQAVNFTDRRDEAWTLPWKPI